MGHDQLEAERQEVGWEYPINPLQLFAAATTLTHHTDWYVGVRELYNSAVKHLEPVYLKL